MSLAAELISIEPSSDRRGKQRRILNLDVDAKSGAAEVTRAAIRNLSEIGFLLETSISLKPGETVQVTLPRSEPRQAKVVWIKHELFGCEFDQPLSAGVIAATRLRANFDEFAMPDDFDFIQPDGWSKRTKASVILGLGIASWAVVAGIFTLAS